ncbi:MAG: TRC40/GET3/ArsA family transport-energizing ATPase [Desulfobacterales bacterium]|nr:TRC40/GET3/ArsA family transport-energizing ATPase [Desulfobacterales bacterium]
MTNQATISGIIPVPPLQLVLFGGKGGVGKTTGAVAAGISLARSHPHLSVMIVSTDPAHSLEDRMIQTVLPPNLLWNELDAASLLDAFKTKHRPVLSEIARRGTFLDDEDIKGFIDLSLPGMDELMAFLEIAQWIEDRRYDLIVIDTAPTGHTLRLLEMPVLSRAWLEALDSLLGKHRYMKQVFSGTYTPDDIDQFILDLSNRIKGLETLLKDPDRCLFVPVLIAEPLSLSETGLLLETLKDREIPVRHLIVNRLHSGMGCESCVYRQTLQRNRLKHHAGMLSGYQLWGVPYIAPDRISDHDTAERPVGKPDTVLDLFFQRAEKLDADSFDPEPAAGTGTEGTGYSVSSPLALPDIGKKLLFFAGKGGVGKTTLASATGVHLSRIYPEREIFIFSTDPAHSLSDCFKQSVGKRPVKVRPNLTLMEMDGQAEFEDLKGLYREEIRAFLSRMASNLDLTFDRQVMERVMDLSPPGVDEIMAVNHALALMEERPDDLFILDTAPTGHLIRLLEMPEIMDQWIKVFFNLFLKYRNIFQTGPLTEKLVRMSKDLKVFGALLHDPGQSGIYLVSILTRMAFEETCDLVEACTRMNIRLDGLWLNLAQRRHNCDVCDRIASGESLVKEAYRNRFKDLATGTVFRAFPPAGCQKLEQLGKVLFKEMPEP